MQTQQEPHRANIDRLNAYRAKQNIEQRRRANLALAVSTYCKICNLNLLQSFAAIRIAITQLEHGCSHYDAYMDGAKAAQIIAQAAETKNTPDPQLPIGSRL